MNREEILRAVHDAAAEYRRVTEDSTEDLSLALALAELDEERDHFRASDD